MRRVYAHLRTIRHRSEVVEFRIEQHLEALKDRLGRVGFGTTIETAGGRGPETRPQLTPKCKRGSGSGVGPARLERATSCSGAARGQRRPAPIGVTPSKVAVS